MRYGHIYLRRLKWYKYASIWHTCNFVNFSLCDVLYTCSLYVQCMLILLRRVYSMLRRHLVLLHGDSIVFAMPSGNIFCHRCKYETINFICCDIIVLYGQFSYWW